MLDSLNSRGDSCAIFFDHAPMIQASHTTYQSRMHIYYLHKRSTTIVYFNLQEELKKSALTSRSSYIECLYSRIRQSEYSPLADNTGIVCERFSCPLIWNLVNILRWMLITTSREFAGDVCVCAIKKDKNCSFTVSGFIS